MVDQKDIGKPVQDMDGRVGILRAIIKDWEDPAQMPSERVKVPTAFVQPPGGGREWMVSPQALARAQSTRCADSRRDDA